jgi:hypothetical protein
MLTGIDKMAHTLGYALLQHLIQAGAQAGSQPPEQGAQAGEGAGRPVQRMEKAYEGDQPSMGQTQLGGIPQLIKHFVDTLRQMSQGSGAGPIGGGNTPPK